MSYNPNGLYASNNSHTGFISLAPNGPELLAPNNNRNIFLVPPLFPTGSFLLLRAKAEPLEQGQERSISVCSRGLNASALVDTLAIATRLFFLTLLSEENITDSRLVIYKY